MEKKTLGNFIAILRKAKGMTQQELAEILNVSNKSVSKWECNDTCPDISLIPVIAEIFEVSCDELLRGEKLSNNAGSDNISSGKNEKRGEKHLKFLVNKNIFRYKNISLISIVFIFIGLVVMYAVSYAAFRPDIGFAISVSLFFMAVSLQIFEINKLNQMKLNDMLEGEKGGLCMSINRAQYRYSLSIIYGAFFFLFIFLPLIIIRSSVIKSVLLFDAYIAFVPVFMVFPAALFFPVKQLYKKQLFKGADVNCNSAGLIVFEAIQAFMLFLMFLNGLFGNHTLSMAWGMDGAAIMVLIVLITFIVAIVKERSKAVVLKMILMLLRNFFYLVSMVYFFDSVMILDGFQGVIFFDNQTPASLSLIILPTIGFYVIDKYITSLKGKGSKKNNDTSNN